MKQHITHLESETIRLARERDELKAAALAFSFQKGKLYWIGHRTSSASTLRCAQVYSAFALSWSTAATPVRDGVLRRTIAFADTATGWSYSSASHASGAPSLVLMRLA